MTLEEYKNSQDYKINEWLQQYEPIQDIAEIEEIHIDRLTENVKNLALQRTGFEPIPLKYVTNKGWYRRYQYLLLFKSESEIDKQKIESHDFLDGLSDWLEIKNKEKDFPQLNGKQVTQVSCANAMTYEESEDGAITNYGLQIYFNIRKEN